MGTGVLLMICLSFHEGKTAITVSLRQERCSMPGRGITHREYPNIVQLRVARNKDGQSCVLIYVIMSREKQANLATIKELHFHAIVWKKIKKRDRKTTGRAGSPAARPIPDRQMAGTK